MGIRRKHPITTSLVAWHSGRTSVSDRRTFAVLHSTCGWLFMWANRPL